MKNCDETRVKNGAWHYPFETGIAMDGYMIILLRTLEIHEENLIRKLAQRILRKQEKSGGWKLYYDEEKDNISSAIEPIMPYLFASGY